MSDFAYIFAALAPAAHVEDINTLSDALGYGPGTLSVKLSVDGSEPATHYGTATYVTEEFLTTLGSGLQGNLPPSLEGQYTAEQMQAILGHLVYTVDSASMKSAASAFQSLLTDNGLQRVAGDAL